jgi:hypothetical protein
MPSVADYFLKNRYQGKYDFGTRVFGHWHKIPFIGTVGSDSIVSDLEGPRLTITLDLPIKYEDKVHHVIIVKHKDVKKLTEF